jgi:hypothetical protein
MSNDIEHSHKEFLISTEHQINIGLKILHLIFLINAGAILAFIGFLTHKSNNSQLPEPWFYGVKLFILGIIFVLVSYAFAYFQQMALTQKYRNENSYYKELKNYDKKLEEYKRLEFDRENNRELLNNQKILINQLYSSLENRYQSIINKFSDWRLWVAVGLAILSIASFIIGTLLVLKGFRN